MFAVGLPVSNASSRHPYHFPLKLVKRIQSLKWGYFHYHWAFSDQPALERAGQVAEGAGG